MHNSCHGTMIALGMFDGMHIGHRALVATNTEVAIANGLEPIVYTFKQHPCYVFGTAPDPLDRFVDRAAVMKQLGAERVILAEFDRKLADTSPRDFVKMLMDEYDMKGVTAGFNYTFGKRAAGNVELLARYADEMGFHLVLTPPVLFDGEIVSSTRIRECIRNGELQKAMQMLGLQ